MLHTAVAYTLATLCVAAPPMWVPYHGSPRCGGQATTLDAVLPIRTAWDFVINGSQQADKVLRTCFLSAPAITGSGRIATLGACSAQDGKTPNNNTLYMLSRSDGSVVWQAQPAPQLTADKDTIPVALDSTYVYVAKSGADVGGDGQQHTWAWAWRQTGGRLAWAVNLDAAIPVPGLVSVIANAPAQQLWVTASYTPASVVLDSSSGDIVTTLQWDTSGGGAGTDLVFSPDGSQVYATTYNSWVSATSTASFKELWRVPVGAATSIVLASPILNAVLTATPGEGLQLYDIGSRRHAGGTPLWANPQPFPQGCSLAAGALAETASAPGFLFVNHVCQGASSFTALCAYDVSRSSSKLLPCIDIAYPITHFAEVDASGQHVTIMITDATQVYSYTYGAAFNGSDWVIGAAPPTIPTSAEAAGVTNWLRFFTPGPVDRSMLTVSIGQGAASILEMTVST